MKNCSPRVGPQHTDIYYTLFLVHKLTTELNNVNEKTTQQLSKNPPNGVCERVVEPE